MREYIVEKTWTYHSSAARISPIGYANVQYDFTARPYRTMPDPFPWKSEGYNHEH